MKDKRISHPRVPPGLRIWFAFHFLVSYALAVPLMLVPGDFLQIIGWPYFDPLAARVVAAGLFAVGALSWLTRKEDMETIHLVLLLKIIWGLGSLAAIWFTLRDGIDVPVLWLLFSIYTAFAGVWMYYKIRMRKLIIDAILLEAAAE